MSIEKGGYDGYYEDVLTIDNGGKREGIDRRLVKTVAIIAGCMMALVIIGIIALKYV